LDTVAILSFALVATLLVISPGPNGILIAKTVPLSGKSAGFANIGGFVVAFYIHGSLSIFGQSIVLVQSPYAFLIFKLLGSTYLCWIGAKSLYEAWKNREYIMESKPAKKSVSKTRAFVEGFMTNALNPKVSMFYLAAFPQFMPNSGDASTAFLLVFIHSAINVIWFSTTVIFLHRLVKYRIGRQAARWLKLIVGVTFIGFGTKLALLKPLNYG
jgi:threonine/homoserine/homoserine lactone efflux protein